MLMLEGLFFTPLKLKHSTLGFTFKSWNEETVVGKFALEYLNNQSLHAGYINYVLHKNYYRE